MKIHFWKQNIFMILIFAGSVARSENLNQRPSGAVDFVSAFSHFTNSEARIISDFKEYYSTFHGGVCYSSTGDPALGVGLLIAGGSLSWGGDSDSGYVIPQGMLLKSEVADFYFNKSFKDALSLAGQTDWYSGFDHLNEVPVYFQDKNYGVLPANVLWQGISGAEQMLVRRGANGNLYALAVKYGFPRPNGPLSALPLMACEFIKNP